MSKAIQWKKIFGGSKPTVPVKIGNKLEALTSTQANRFEELMRSAGPAPAKRNPLEDSHYSLADAAFRLMTNEAQILRRAAAGEFSLFVPVAGVAGHWRLDGVGGRVSESSLQVLKAGYLALDAAACRQIAASDRTMVSVLEFRRPAESSDTGLDSDVLGALAAWGAGRKRFVLQPPKTYRREQLVLLAPLGGTGGALR